MLLLFFACLVVTKHSSTKFGASSSPTNANLASSTLQVTDSATSGLLYCNWCIIVDCCFFSAECCMALSLSLGAQSAASWVALLNRNRCIIVDCCFCALSLSLQRQVLHSLSPPSLYRRAISQKMQQPLQSHSIHNCWLLFNALFAPPSLGPFSRPFLSALSRPIDAWLLIVALSCSL